jgi:hypothetical protein
LTAVDLNPGVEYPGLTESAQFTNFRQRLGQEPLPAKSRIDGHHKDDIAQMQYLLDQKDGTCRIKHGARLLAQFANARQHPMEMDR